MSIWLLGLHREAQAPFWAPERRQTEALGSPLGAQKGGLWRPIGAQDPSGSDPKIRYHFGTILAPKMLPGTTKNQYKINSKRHLV